MDMESRRRFVNSMMAATLAAMGADIWWNAVFGHRDCSDGGPPYVPMGGVQNRP